MERSEDIIGKQISRLLQSALSRLIKPDITVNKVSDLDTKEMERIKKELGIEAIILDVDETLRTDMQPISKTNQEWIETLKGKVKIIVLSNGIDQSIEEYFRNIGIDYIGFACKPLKANFVRACTRMGVRPENVMVVGDSLFSDIFGGQRNRMKTVHVRSCNGADDREL